MENITTIIKREMEKRNLSAYRLSRRIEIHESTTLQMLNRKSIQVQRLIQVCHAMQYNFFREFAEELPYEQPKMNQALLKMESKLNAEIEKLKEENKELKIKLEVYKDVIEKIG